MSVIDSYEYTRRPGWRKQRHAKKPDRRAVKTQMRLFADPPKKPAATEAAPFDDFDQLTI